MFLLLEYAFDVATVPDRLSFFYPFDEFKEVE
jgi:hypothetical protein